MKKLCVLSILLSIAVNAQAQNISINTTGAANSTLSMLEVLQISTTSNTKALHVSHSGTITGIGYGVWSEVTGGSTTNIAGYFNATAGATNNYALIVPSGGGRVGIGTATPDATRVLTVQGSGAASEMIALKNTAGTTTWHINATGGADNLNFAETFVADGRFYLEAGGNIGIGTIDPVSRLHINQNGAELTLSSTTLNSASRSVIMFDEDDGSSPSMSLSYDGSSTGDNNALHIHDASSGVDRVTFLRGGDVGIGDATPSYQLQLSTNSAAKPSSNAWTVSSDARLKNIQGPYTKGLKEILQLQPVMYHYKNVGDKKFPDEVCKALSIGFSAQEVQKIFPEAVGVDKNDGYLNFDIHSILIAYVNAFKEQQALINSLQKHNENLLLRVEKMESLFNLNDTKENAVTGGSPTNIARYLKHAR